MRFKKQIKILVSAILAVALLITQFSASAATLSGLQKNLSDLQSKYKSLEVKQEQMKEQYERAVQDKENRLEYKNLLQEKINATIEQLDILVMRIEILDNDIETLEEQVEKKEKEIDANYETYKERVRAIYMAGETGLLEFVLSSSSISDFFDRMVIAKSTSDHDNSIIEGLKGDKQELEDTKKRIEDNRRDLSSTKAELEAKQDELDRLYEENNAVIKELEKNESYYLSEQKKKAAEMKELNADIEKAYKEIEKKRQEIANQNNDPTGGGKTSSGSSGSGSSGSGSASTKVISGKVYSSGLMWPTPTLSTITSGFRTKSRPNHNGVDISGRGAYGSAIIATMGGTVYKVGDHGSKSYGKFVMIDHGTINGKSYVTLYAHCSAIYVSKGQTVKQGQKIAAVGSTGNSTGPHLHFEVRVNGNYTNPLNYFK